MTTRGELRMRLSALVARARMIQAEVMRARVDIDGAIRHADGLVADLHEIVADLDREEPPELKAAC